MLEKLFEKIPFAQIISRPQINVSGVATDSNLVEAGDLFVPIVGDHYNGYKFISHALEKGAAAVAGDEIKTRKNHLACIYLPNAANHVPFLSAAVYGEPTKNLQVVGVTGTNGKTTTAHIIEALLRSAYDDRAGYIGTTAYRWAKSHQEATYTTPPAPQLQRIFRKMVESEVHSVVLECSSHGIDQGRLNFTHLDVGVFTNLTSDHLDYHQNFVSYRNAKWKMFSELLINSEKKDKFAIFNIDDSTGRSWAREDLPQVETITYSVDHKSAAKVFPKSYELTKNSIVAKIQTPDHILDIKSPMLGLFNLQNILASVAVAHALHLDMTKVQNVISQGVYVPGRMEKIVDTDPFHVFIDYAHTEDALSRVLDVLQSMKEKKIITVFGCGGNADMTKRPKMGEIAAQKSDVVIVTTDNPRNEDPEKIMDDIFIGIDRAIFPSKEILRISKREDAIAKALDIAQPGDIVLIAGKGHEVYQEIAGTRHSFEDRKIVKAWLKQK